MPHTHLDSIFCTHTKCEILVKAMLRDDQVLEFHFNSWDSVNFQLCSSHDSAFTEGSNVMPERYSYLCILFVCFYCSGYNWHWQDNEDSVVSPQAIQSKDGKGRQVGVDGCSSVLNFCKMSKRQWHWSYAHLLKLGINFALCILLYFQRGGSWNAFR